MTGPIAYGYAAVPIAYKSRDDDLSNQVRLITEYAKNLEGFTPGPMVTEFFTINKGMRLRPDGGRLNEALKPGDAILIGTGYRAFENVGEMVDQIRGWMSLGIWAHIIDAKINTQTPIGLFAFENYAYAAEFRIKKLRGVTAMERAGTIKSHYPYVRHPCGAKWRFSKKWRALGKEIVGLVDDGMTYHLIYLHYLKTRRALPSHVYARHWNEGFISNTAVWEKRAQVMEEVYPEYEWPEYLTLESEVTYRQMLEATCNLEPLKKSKYAPVTR